MSVFNASSKTNILKTGPKTKYFDNLLAMVEMPPHNKTLLNEKQGRVKREAVTSETFQLLLLLVLGEVGVRQLEHDAGVGAGVRHVEVAVDPRQLHVLGLREDQRRHQVVSHPHLQQHR